ncbi:MAG: hypothetical protein WC055_10050 [Melioribacteraceae bacterium]
MRLETNLLNLNNTLKKLGIKENYTLHHNNDGGFRLSILNSNRETVVDNKDVFQCNSFISGALLMLNFFPKKATEQLIFSGTASIPTEAIVMVDEEDKWTRENK